VLRARDVDARRVPPLAPAPLFFARVVDAALLPLVPVVVFDAARRVVVPEAARRVVVPEAARRVVVLDAARFEERAPLVVEAVDLAERRVLPDFALVADAPAAAVELRALALVRRLVVVAEDLRAGFSSRSATVSRATSLEKRLGVPSAFMS
jgi:hypothetical protein